MNSIDQLRQQQTRRAVLEGSTLGLGAIALSQLSASASAAEKPRDPNGGLQGLPHFSPRVRRVIYLFLVRWPGKVEAGAVDDQSFITAVDLLPTFCEVAGVKLPDGYTPDGVSQVAALKGQPVPSRAKPLFWKMKGGCGSVRQ